MTKTISNQIIGELEISLEKLKKDYILLNSNKRIDLENTRNEFFERGEKRLDEVLKNHEIERYQLNGKILNHLRLLITKHMIEIK